VAPRENRLASEASPYLRQHSENPVDWFPFGDEAFSEARRLDRPLFISIGYSTCHWCHVMAHESFEDEETAREMNESVVAVKVDREERPDVDAVYMEAVMAATGNGGWPMSVFATAEGKPFFAGTYFPKQPTAGMPSFRQVLAAVADVWRNRRDDVESQAAQLSAAVARRLSPPEGGEDDGGLVTLAQTRTAVLGACRRLAEMSDREQGGFGRQPKFPQPLLLDLLLRAEATGLRPEEGPLPLEVATEALSAMASGGIYDHLGGGFSRYSVDRYWLVPHFEKMLYDQALLARVYLHAWQLTKDPRWRQVMDETFGYMLSRLSHPSGGLCSAEDADSEGEEGRYYLWSAAEFAEAVGPELAEPAAAWYGVTEEGNFEGRNVLHLAERGRLLRPPEIEEARSRLFRHRAGRVPPGLDDKVLTEWNAMACSVMAEAAAATSDEVLGAAARRVGAVLLDARSRSGRTVRSPAGREPAAFAADVAWLLDAVVRLFELSGEERYLVEASGIAAELIDGYVDVRRGFVFTTRVGEEPPVVRPAESADGVTPSAASVAALGLARLALLLGDPALSRAASAILAAHRQLLASSPVAVPELLAAGELLGGGSLELAATGSGRWLLAEVRSRFLPGAVYAWRAEEGTPHLSLPLLEQRGGDAVYVCRAGTCRLPARDRSSLEAELEAVLASTGPGGAP
jgi:uncharacterized protein YyaL (SSP411 family)